MNDNVREFLEKFAEMERRVRKLAAEDRALRQELGSLQEKLQAARSEAALLRDALMTERGTRRKARDQLNDLINGLSDLKSGPPAKKAGKNLAEVMKVEH